MSAEIVKSICSSAYAATLLKLELTGLGNASMAALDLSRFRSLQWLGLQRTFSEDATSSLLHVSTTLRSLELDRIHVSQEAHVAFLARLPHLHELALIDSTVENGRGLLELAVRERLLTSVTFRYDFADGIDISGAATQLVHLKVSYVSGYTYV